MTNEDTEIEAEARNLFNCEKDIINYLVESAGTIGPSKLSDEKRKNNPR